MNLANQIRFETDCPGDTIHLPMKWNFSTPCRDGALFLPISKIMF